MNRPFEPSDVGGKRFRRKADGSIGTLGKAAWVHKVLPFFVGGIPTPSAEPLAFVGPGDVDPLCSRCDSVDPVGQSCACFDNGGE